MSGFWLLASLGLAAWFWYANLQARELAVGVARQTCTSQRLQLLDNTVALSGLSLKQGANGRPALRRSYQFEYSEDGDNRKRGFIILIGRHVETIGLASPDRY